MYLIPEHIKDKSITNFKNGGHESFFQQTISRVINYLFKKSVNELKLFLIPVINEALWTDIYYIKWNVKTTFQIYHWAGVHIVSTFTYRRHRHRDQLKNNIKLFSMIVYDHYVRDKVLYGASGRNRTCLRRLKVSVKAEVNTVAMLSRRKIRTLAWRRVYLPNWCGLCA